MKQLPGSYLLYSRQGKQSREGVRSLSSGMEWNEEHWTLRRMGTSKEGDDGSGVRGEEQAGWDGREGLEVHDEPRNRRRGEGLRGRMIFETWVRMKMKMGRKKGDKRGRMKWRYDDIGRRGWS